MSRKLCNFKNKTDFVEKFLDFISLKFSIQFLRKSLPNIKTKQAKYYENVDAKFLKSVPKLVSLLLFLWAFFFHLSGKLQVFLENVLNFYLFFYVFISFSPQKSIFKNSSEYGNYFVWIRSAIDFHCHALLLSHESVIK